MGWRGFSVLVCASVCFGGAAGDLAREIAQIGLDPDECYRVHDLTLVKQDARVYLTDGYLIFSQPVAGARVLAVFSSDVETGDAEVLLMPPSRSERRSLASYTGSPNMDEHFDVGVLVFTDETYRETMAQLAGNPMNRKIREIGALLAEKWSPTARNIAGSFETRLVLDLLTPGRKEGFFTAAVRGRKCGNFDVTYDPEAREQIIVGQVAYREGRPFLDIWTSFEASRFRKGEPRAPEAGFQLSDYRIEATLGADLTLEVRTKVRLKATRDGLRVLPFDISPEMRVMEAKVDGEVAETLASESMRSNLLRNNGNDLFLLAAPRTLEKGREYELEFRGAGRVIRDAGNKVYYVGSRSNWYPRSALQFATYDLTFRYPRGLDLVTAGEVVSDRTEGEERVTRRRTSAPILFAGFNLGAYERAKVTRAGYTVEVCANRGLESALERRASAPADPLPQVPQPNRRRSPGLAPPLTATPPPPRPASKLQELAGEIAAELEFMAGRFGPPPLGSLTVAPVPGTFGQGFPGLIYLSTLSYVAPAMAALTGRQEMFFSEVLHAHEVAHQWWGNVVTADGYHDSWLMEALANYSGLMYIEKRKGPRAIEPMLNEYREALLKKTAGGGEEDAAGPVTMGVRLASSLSPEAWKTIVYGKGSWIMHMLRRRMGDEKFLAMLGEVRRRYEWRAMTTEEFRGIAARFLPAGDPDPKLESFFAQWVYGTGIPALKLRWSAKGAAPAVKLTGTVEQSEVADDFSVLAPVEIQFAKGRPVTRWVQTAGEGVTFTMTLKQAPAKVALDPRGSVLRR